MAGKGSETLRIGARCKAAITVRSAIAYAYAYAIPMTSTKPNSRSGTRDTP